MGLSRGGGCDLAAPPRGRVRRPRGRRPRRGRPDRAASPSSSARRTRRTPDAQALGRRSGGRPASRRRSRSAAAARRAGGRAGGRRRSRTRSRTMLLVDVADPVLVVGGHQVAQRGGRVGRRRLVEAGGHPGDALERLALGRGHPRGLGQLLLGRGPPSWPASSAVTASSRCRCSPTSRGMRMVRPCCWTARWRAWRIHQVA